MKVYYEFDVGKEYDIFEKTYNWLNDCSINRL